MKLEPVVLEGRHVRLEPMTAAHAPALVAIARPELFRYMPFSMHTAAAVDDFLRISARLAAKGTACAFAIVALRPRATAGGTGYWNYDAEHRRLEIGATWLAPDFQRTAVNTEAKYLLLQHAFERLGCQRVEFKTDSLNAPSRAALQRIGAVEEGTLRNHMVMPDGRKRHSVAFSVIAEEWPAVKARLEGMMAKREIA
jgi:N-acetyltransferase